VDLLKTQEDRIQRQIGEGLGNAPQKRSSLMESIGNFFSPASAYAGESDDVLARLDEMRKQDEIKAKIDEEWTTRKNAGEVGG
jgi:hypothetical protein